MLFKPEVVLISPEEDTNHCWGALVPAWEQGRTGGSQGSPRPRHVPSTAGEAPGFGHPRRWVSRRQRSTCARAGRLTNPSRFTFTSRLLFGANTVVRRFTKSEEMNSHEGNESPDYLMTT